MDDTRIPKNILNSKPEGRRNIGRQKLRWLDGVEDDLRTLGAYVLLLTQRSWRVSLSTMHRQFVDSVAENSTTSYTRHISNLRITVASLAAQTVTKVRCYIHLCIAGVICWKARRTASFNSSMMYRSLCKNALDETPQRIRLSIVTGFHNTGLRGGHSRRADKMGDPRPIQCPYAEACYTYRSQAAIHTTVMHITDPPVLLQSPHTGHDVIYTPCTVNLIWLLCVPRPKPANDVDLLYVKYNLSIKIPLPLNGIVLNAASLNNLLKISALQVPYSLDLASSDYSMFGVISCKMVQRALQFQELKALDDRPNIEESRTIQSLRLGEQVM
ncbi:hypothetical protein ANN_15620 [Periplaneta americana]|uniref:Uncharacterized protein n=1 Tax=Periplaneta americana TaxID=6978 RepID=A0ABQ8SGU5_PERAM|nr:hypothetical protein ANN_15620 [Periplaneta americana]